MKESQNKIPSYREELLNAPHKSAESSFQKIADSFEDDLLELDGFPESYFEFVIELLSRSEFYSKPGLWNFMLVLGTERHKMLPRHYAALANTIVGNYASFLDGDLCLAVCDFIARNYTTAEAAQLFNRLLEQEKEKPQELHGFVNEGRKILELEDARRLKGAHLRA